MPELPEVETVRRGLLDLIKGKTIAEVVVYYPNIITNNVEEFKLKLIGQKITDIKRRGKYLIFELTDYDLLSHLRMEGKYQLLPKLDNRDKHVHIVFRFTDGTNLAYRDVRKFGRMTLFAKDQVQQSKALQKLGPEPTKEDFDLNNFIKSLKQHHKPIKNVLLDQTVVAGLGNIYADEVLFKAGISPLRPAAEITAKEAEKLHSVIITTMAKAILARGTTIRSYANAFGENGTYQQQLEVYGQPGQPCVKCGTPIEKIKLGGRGTHFCPQCQI